MRAEKRAPAVHRSVLSMEIAESPFSSFLWNNEGMGEGKPSVVSYLESERASSGEAKLRFFSFPGNSRSHHRSQSNGRLSCFSSATISNLIQTVFSQLLRSSLTFLFFLILFARVGLCSPPFVRSATPFPSPCPLLLQSLSHSVSLDLSTRESCRSPSFSSLAFAAPTDLPNFGEALSRNTSHAWFILRPNFARATVFAFDSLSRRKTPFSDLGLSGPGARSVSHQGTLKVGFSRVLFKPGIRTILAFVKVPYVRAVLPAWSDVTRNSLYPKSRRTTSPVSIRDVAWNSSSVRISSSRQHDFPVSLSTADALHEENVGNVSPCNAFSRQSGCTRAYVSKGPQRPLDRLSEDADKRPANRDSPGSSPSYKARSETQPAEVRDRSGSSSSSPASPASPPRRKSFLLSNLKAEQQRLREAREQAEASRALHAEEEKKKTERSRRRRAREASLINRKKQRKSNHLRRLTKTAKRRQYLREKRERMDRIFLEDLQVQRSTERTLRRRDAGGRRSEKAHQITELETLIQSSTLLIQIEANALTPNQRWELVRGLALKGFYIGYKFKMAKNSLMKVAIRRILDRQKARNQGIAHDEAGEPSRLRPSQISLVSTQPTAGACSGLAESIRGQPYRDCTDRMRTEESHRTLAVLSDVEAPLSSKTSGVGRKGGAAGVLSGTPQPRSVPRVRRDFWITHEEELQAKALQFNIDISGKKPKSDSSLEQEDDDGIDEQHIDAREPSEARVAARLESALASAVWRDDPRFSHLALGAGPGGVWTQWEDDDEIEEEMSKSEMPEDIASAAMPYMEVDDWMDLFQEEITAMRAAKQEAKEREKEILNTTPLEGEVVPIAENAEALIPHLENANLYLFVRAMPGNEKRLPNIVRAVFQLLEEISFENRAKLQQKGPPPRKYKGQWYDEELLPHIKPEIAAELGFWQLPTDGNAEGKAIPGSHTSKKTTAVGGDIKMAMLGRSVLTLPELKRFAKTAPVRKKLIGKICGSLLGVAQRLTCATQAVPLQLVCALSQLCQRSPQASDTKPNTNDT
ncbi:transmembrane protein [Cystoisospora suis]|uniref:Transmembrane protein n=1 Tax=Cystoisospora suis TaxID=483139 RepID=A0A2C6KP56_9APIC|nr:transmembrane protein [Cystoisospora suis]